MMAEGILSPQMDTEAKPAVMRISRMDFWREMIRAIHVTCF